MGFAAVHVSNYGRNWNLESADGMRKTAQKAVAKIKSMISGSAAFDEYVKSGERAVVDALRRADESGVNVGDADRNEIKRLLQELVSVANDIVSERATLTDAVKDGSGAADPRAAIAQIRKTLRVFPPHHLVGLYCAMTSDIIISVLIPWRNLS